MCRSSVSASGRCSLQAASASSPSAAVGDHVEALAPEGVGQDAAHQPRVVGDDDSLRAVR